MEYAIVTIRTRDKTWETDMELPAKMRLKDVALKVLDTMKAMDETRFGELHKLRFVYEDKLLNEEATLADYQIWDGCIVSLDC